MRQLLDDIWEAMTDPDDSIRGIALNVTLWIVVLDSPLLIWRLW
jgi:hypothetical protein